jgi:hypothetical protein
MRSEDRKLFLKMLDECYQLAEAISSKGELFVTESLLTALVLQQQKMIRWLINDNHLDRFFQQ